MQVLGDPSYLAAALRAGELVWQRGLLRKGPGLCHGVSGNAYALLRLYKTTQVGEYSLFAAGLQGAIRGARAREGGQGAPSAAVSPEQGRTIRTKR
jgi:hypothetical protein